MGDTRLKSIFASAVSTCITVVVISAVTIGGELSLPFKNWMASFTGHHWITKSWLSLIIFAIGFIIFRLIAPMNEKATRRAIVSLSFFVVLGTVVLVGFYLYEFLAH